MFLFEKIVTVMAVLSTAASWDIEGHGTFYGGIGGQWGPGTCHQTYIPQGFWEVALNRPDYGDGTVCGSCLEGCMYFNDGGKRCFKGIINNACNSCGPGDLDFGLEGDGKYEIKWKYIDCPKIDKPLLSVDSASSNYWAAIKVEGMGPQKKCKVNGVEAYRANGMWGISDPLGNLGCGPKIQCELLNGEYVEDCMEGQLFGGGFCRDGNKRCHKRLLQDESGDVIEEVVLENDEEHRRNRELHNYITPPLPKKGLVDNEDVFEVVVEPDV
mmetsp:Transcript_923/g.1178  ORF Transcript_923/g.1178 Transcript_923/m.1178 type:complete len:270 (+) Transcript_923:75-884(+)